VWQLSACRPISTAGGGALATGVNDGELARAMQTDIYAWFTGCFESADLRHAKALFDELDAQ
jgi:hypothetical protein